MLLPSPGAGLQDTEIHRSPAGLLQEEWWRRGMEMEMDFSSTHTGCKGRSQSGVALPGQTPGMILLPLPSSCSQYLYFHLASSPCPPHCSRHTYQYLLQREIFTAFLPLLALYKGTHISFGVFERNNTHKHFLPLATGTCAVGASKELKRTTRRRHRDTTAELAGPGSCLRFALAWSGDFSPFPSGNASPGPG